MTDSADLVGRLDSLFSNKLLPTYEDTDAASAEIKRLTSKLREIEADMEYQARAHSKLVNDLQLKIVEIEAETREACAKIAESPVGLARLCPYGGDKPGDSTWDHTDEDVCPVCKVKCKDSLAKCTDNVGGRIAAAIRSHASQGEKK